MTWHLVLLPRAEADLADDVKDAALRRRIVASLQRAVVDPEAAPITDDGVHRVVSFYVAASRGPIMVHAAFTLKRDMVLVDAIAFDDEGGSLGRPPPAIL